MFAPETHVYARHADGPEEVIVVAGPYQEEDREIYLIRHDGNNYDIYDIIDADVLTEIPRVPLGTKDAIFDVVCLNFDLIRSHHVWHDVNVRDTSECWMCQIFAATGAM